jgi:hypothetical protein
VGLLPHGDGLRFVVVHLFVHAYAVLADDGGFGAALVVVDALVDPLEVVGVHLLSKGA